MDDLPRFLHRLAPLQRGLHVTQLRQVDPARRVESLSVTRRTVDSNHTNHPAPSSFVWALPYRDPSRRNHHVESSRHSPDNFISTSLLHNSAASTLGGSPTRGHYTTGRI